MRQSRPAGCDECHQGAWATLPRAMAPDTSVAADFFWMRVGEKDPDAGSRSSRDTGSRLPTSAGADARLAR
jgi:hypothetical protein